MTRSEREAEAAASGWAGVARLEGLRAPSPRSVARRAVGGGACVAEDGRQTLDARLHELRERCRAAPLEPPPGPLVAPLPGLLVAVHVGVGDRVGSGQAVATLEAMKMRNELCAPRAGVVRAIGARVGTVVAQDTVLVEFDADDAQITRLRPSQ